MECRHAGRVARSSCTRSRALSGSRRRASTEALMLGDTSLRGKLKRDTSAVEQMAAVALDLVTAKVVTLTDLRPARSVVKNEPDVSDKSLLTISSARITASDCAALRNALALADYRRGLLIQDGAPSSVELSVSSRTSDPSARITAISPYGWNVPASKSPTASSLKPCRAVANAIHSPSGEYAGCASLPADRVSRCNPVPSRRIR